jgi:hypothetical protein
MNSREEVNQDLILLTTLLTGLNVMIKIVSYIIIVNVVGGVGQAGLNTDRKFVSTHSYANKSNAGGNNQSSMVIIKTIYNYFDRCFHQVQVRSNQHFLKKKRKN